MEASENPLKAELATIEDRIAKATGTAKARLERTYGERVKNLRVQMGEEVSAVEPAPPEPTPDPAPAAKGKKAPTS
jgi:hypothetical protein